MQAAVSAKLMTGTTPFDRLDVSATLAQGALAVQQAQLAGAAGTVTLTGTADLPGDAWICAWPRTRRRPVRPSSPSA